MKHYQTLKVLKAVEIEFSKTPTIGICILALDFMENSFSLLETTEIYVDIKQAMTEWPKYSGDSTFPIKLNSESKHSENLCNCYNLIALNLKKTPKYYNEYITLRKELLEFLITYFSKGKDHGKLSNT